MISPLAYVDKEAKIGENVTVHPFAYIEKMWRLEITARLCLMPVF